MTKLKNSGKWNKELREETETMHRYEYGNKDASHLLIQLIDEHNPSMMEKEIDAIQNEAGDDFHLIAFEVNDWNDDLYQFTITHRSLPKSLSTLLPIDQIMCTL